MTSARKRGGHTPQCYRAHTGQGSEVVRPRRAIIKQSMLHLQADCLQHRISYDRPHHPIMMCRTCRLRIVHKELWTKNWQKNEHLSAFVYTGLYPLQTSTTVLRSTLFIWVNNDMVDFCQYNTSRRPNESKKRHKERENVLHAIRA